MRLIVAYAKYCDINTERNSVKSYTICLHDNETTVDRDNLDAFVGVNAGLLSVIHEQRASVGVHVYVR